MKKRRWIGGCFLMFSLIIAIGIGYFIYTGKIIPNKIWIGAYKIQGVDVSSYQGEIDWKILEKQNIQFAFIKATEGSSYVDEYFKSNWEQAKNTGLKIGAYHFFSFDSAGSTQAKNFIQTVGKEIGCLVPVVDIEFYADKKKNKPNSDKIREELNIYLKELEEFYGKKPILYAAKDSYEYFLKGYYPEYPIWIRSILWKPQIDRAWSFWQYTNREHLEGYRGKEYYIDKNVFYGTEEELEAFLITE